MARGYFATHISENLQETPEGFLIAPGCVIARTGWQEYMVKDLPQQAAIDLDVDISNPNATIELYRRPEDVFHPDTLRSFEGKAVTDQHPKDFVDPTNFNDVARGHVQNVRKGTEPLESGDMPLLGDIHITAEPLLSKVKNNLMREISCGYDYSITRDGEKICQIDIIGNHVAVVPKGRAGEEARINDAALEIEPPAQEAVSTTPVYPPIPFPTLPTKEKHVAETTKKGIPRFFRNLFGKQLIEMARATDADPEKVFEAANEMHTFVKDEAEEEVKPVEKEEKSEEGADNKAADAKAADKHKHLHDALDKALAGDKSHAKDADLEQLKTLLDAFLTEEEKEPEHSEDDEEEVDLTPLEETLNAEDEEPCAECGETDCECADDESDPGQELEPDGEEELEDDELEEEEQEAAASSKDKRRAHDSALAVLKVLRPSVARSNDKAVHAAFNTALKTVKKHSKPSTASYKSVSSASRARDKAAERAAVAGKARAADASKNDPIAKLQEFYNSANKGGK